jgi:hypothetical protein
MTGRQAHKNWELLVDLNLFSVRKWLYSCGTNCAQTLSTRLLRNVSGKRTRTELYTHTSIVEILCHLR